MKVTQSGLYKLEAINSCGLVRDSTYVELLYSPNVNLGNDTSLHKPFSLTLDGGVVNGKYLWNTGDTTQTIVVSEFGTYWVQHRNVCDTLRDSILLRSKLGVIDVDEDRFVILPNPTKGKFQILLKDFEVIDFSIYNEVGQSVEIKSQRLNDVYQIDFLHSVPGIYYLEIKQAGKVHWKKVILL